MRNTNRPSRQQSSASAVGNASFHRPKNQQPNGNNASQWQRNYEHYRDLAQRPGDADTVTREQYWQHAEHFCRLMNGSAT
jgi:hypothetical protein